ncbi:hypothetical protein Q3G72_015888 [Acer saccharum]|nr:hypothetical protein Q3G72_015888 [Acer saccharum]
MKALNEVRSGLQGSPKSVTVEGVSLDKEITKSRPSMELEFSQANKHNKEIEKLVSELGSGSICHVQIPSQFCLPY